MSEQGLGRDLNDIRIGSAFKLGAAFAAGWVLVSTILTPILIFLMVLIVLVLTGVWP